MYFFTIVKDKLGGESIQLSHKYTLAKNKIINCFYKDIFIMKYLLHIIVTVLDQK